jgi:hypothetical protein
VFRDFLQSLELSSAAMHLLWVIPLMLALASAGKLRTRLTDFVKQRERVPSAASGFARNF